MRRIIVLTVAAAAFTSFNAGADAASRYCLTQALSKAKNCSYISLAQCTQAKGSPDDDCQVDTGTTGGKASSPSR